MVKSVDNIGLLGKSPELRSHTGQPVVADHLTPSSHLQDSSQALSQKSMAIAGYMLTQRWGQQRLLSKFPLMNKPAADY